MIELADQVWFSKWNSTFPSQPSSYIGSDDPSVTGSSSGLGLALVKYLVSLNVKCIATSRNPSGIADIGRPDKYLALPVDVTKVDQIHSAFEKGLEKFQKITHVVNNAGYGLLGEFEGTMEEEARRQMEVNYWGIGAYWCHRDSTPYADSYSLVNVSREALRIFREVNKPLFGRLINISSIGGVDAQPALPFYHSAYVSIA
jgi:NAD(P)-dependent dehydrogenase (short-subunit alcohol dehydrogenase family)